MVWAGVEIPWCTLITSYAWLAETLLCCSEVEQSNALRIFTVIVSDMFWPHVIDVTRSRSHPVRYVRVLTGKEGYDHDTRVAVFSVPSENQTCRPSEAQSCAIIGTHGFGASEPVLKSSRWISKHTGFEPQGQIRCIAVHEHASFSKSWFQSMALAAGATTFLYGLLHSRH